MSDGKDRKPEIRWEKPKPARREEPERKPARKAEPAFPEDPGTGTKPGDPPLERPLGDRSRHGDPGDGER